MIHTRVEDLDRAMLWLEPNAGDEVARRATIIGRETRHRRRPPALPLAALSAGTSVWGLSARVTGIVAVPTQTTSSRALIASKRLGL